MKPALAGTLADLRAGRLASARRLDLGGAGLRQFPPEIFTLADTLEELNLSGNALDVLPDALPQLHRLRILFASNNRFTQLPRVLGNCPQLEMVGFKANRIHVVPADCFGGPRALRWLILTDNAIAQLPPSLGDCAQMQKLMLAGNQLATLPDSLAGCTALELLRLSANRFETLPDWLTQLPRLAWLACAGNPFNAEQESRVLEHSPLPAIPWAALEVGERLGQGASGHIHAALHHAEHGKPQAVALKLFKGEVTSDGWPRSEMAASLAAGADAHLVAAHGRISDHPQGLQALLMERLAPDWRPLAGPPSFDSCTRDIYPPDLVLPLPAVLALARDVAAATAHLHAQGLLHGDLYAHNTLWRTDARGQVQARLSDFGAAALLPDAGWAARLQPTDRRAFGYLLQELIAHAEAPATPTDHAAHQALGELREACLQATPGDRPTMATLHRRLDALVRAQG